MGEIVSPTVQCPHASASLLIETWTVNHACQVAHIQVQRVRSIAFAAEMMHKQSVVLG